MTNRNKRRVIAEDTLYILDKGFFETPNGEIIDIKETQSLAENNTIVYSPESSDLLIKNRVDIISNNKTEIEVTKETTLNATRRLIKEGHTDVLCLNFASAKNAGGGFLGGSQAQEESIARSTGLYNCQQKAAAYYKSNRKIRSCFYTDYMIYSPNVPIIKDEDGNNLEELVTASIITAPAVNTGVVKHREKDRMHEIEIVMKRRIEKVLAIALEHQHKAIVLGAWGCGVFQNKPEDIADYFKEIIETKFKNDFNKIVFAVYSKNERFIAPFYEAFGK
ncbi:MAG TPA: TIGR02452 family protein [Bacteroidetes bacterium]|nr:TIGR02452 family protein [Bacteroidota bacterium]